LPHPSFSRTAVDILRFTVTESNKTLKTEVVVASMNLSPDIACKSMGYLHLQDLKRQWPVIRKLDILSAPQGGDLQSAHTILFT
jgi:hypothetical protein